MFLRLRLNLTLRNTSAATPSKLSACEPNLSAAHSSLQARCVVLHVRAIQMHTNLVRHALPLTSTRRRSPPPVDLPVAQPATLGTALPDDPWLAPDKLQHFLFCAAVTAAGYLAARAHERLRRHRLTLGCAAGVAAGVLKEAGDILGWWPGALSVRDLGADAVGVAAALAGLVAAEARHPRRAAAAGVEQAPARQLAVLQKGMV